MQIKPLNSHPTPDYPTIKDADQMPELLKRVPHSWLTSSRFTPLIGLGLLAKSVLSPTTAGAEVRPASSKEEAVANPQSLNKDQSNEEIKRTSSLVAPILQEALDLDGRGSFGCVAMNPPVFLAEDEAVELIKRELEKAGLKLSYEVILKDVPQPTAEMKYNYKQRQYSKPELSKRCYEFDLVDQDKSIYIEYLSKNDYRKWFPTRSTADSYNFPQSATLLADSFKMHDSETPKIFGVFFDPLAYVDRRYRDSTTSGLSQEQIHLLEREEKRYKRKEELNIIEQAKFKLKRQIAYFIETLRKEGIIEEGS